jgi:rRNA-processing protein FCF1
MYRRKTMTSKRKNEEVEQDFQKILGLYKSCSTLDEIAEKSGLTRQMVLTSLKKHPQKRHEVMAQLRENRRNTEESDETNPVAKEGENSELEGGVVIDASITGYPGIIEEIKKIPKIILTSVTIEELDKLGKINDLPGKVARDISNMALEDEKGKFVFAEITENEDWIPDNRIVNFCKEKNVSLITSDKIMALKAKCMNVNVRYYKIDKKVSQENISNTANATKTNEDEYIGEAGKKYVSLWDCKFSEKGEMCVLLRDDDYIKRYLVKKSGEFLKKGKYSVVPGDSLYVSTRKHNQNNDKYYFSFAHYQFLNSNENTVELVTCGRIYTKEQINKFKNSKYKEFLNYVTKDYF